MHIPIITAFRSDYPETAFSWSLEAEKPLTPLRGSLTLSGVDLGYEVGDQITVDRETYIITNVTESEPGMDRTTTLTCRDLLFNLYTKHSLKNLVWMSVPPRFVRQETIQNLMQPVKTELRIRHGDIFGVGGWRMSEIVEQVAAIAGLSVSYGLPDFWVKQLTLERHVPLLDFLSAQLSSLMPRMFVSGSRLYILPFKAKSGHTFYVPAAESLTKSTTLAEKYALFRVNGGQAKFDIDKWEGLPLQSYTGTTARFMISPVAGYAICPTPYGTRVYYQTITTSLGMTKVMTVYAKDAFNNDQSEIFRHQWKFTRKAPVVIATTSDAMKSAEAYFKENQTSLEVTEGVDDKGWPSPSQYWLDSYERTINVYRATTIDWESPLLIETHRAIWKHLYWSNHTITAGESCPIKPAATQVQSNPPAAHDDPVNEGIPFVWPPGFPKVYTQIATTDDSDIRDVVGVWNMNTFWESTYHHYDSERIMGRGATTTSPESSVSEQYRYDGGLLWWRLTRSVGVCIPLLENVRHYGGRTYYTARQDKDYRVEPAYPKTPGDSSPSVAIYNDASGGLRVLHESREHYREVNLYTVVKAIHTIKMSPDTYTWFDEHGSSLAGRGETFSQYVAEAQNELIPWDQVPQQFVRQRGMQAYYEVSGSGPRVVEVGCPHIVSWEDLNNVARHIMQTHPDNRKIRTYSVRAPGRYAVTPAVFGSTISLPGVSTPGRLVGMGYTAHGTGEHSTTFMLQDELP